MRAGCGVRGRVERVCWAASRYELFLPTSQKREFRQYTLAVDIWLEKVVYEVRGVHPGDSMSLFEPDRQTCRRTKHSGVSVTDTLGNPSDYPCRNRPSPAETNPTGRWSFAELSSFFVDCLLLVVTFGEFSPISADPRPHACPGRVAGTQYIRGVPNKRFPPSLWGITKICQLRCFFYGYFKTKT